MTLVKVIADARDHITGPVTKFDPEALKRQMMQRQWQQQPQIAGQLDGGKQEWLYPRKSTTLRE